jgi:mannose-6-phosphate isomerase-like protein (cupin superfamily)
MTRTAATQPHAIHLVQKFDLFSEQWSPKMVAEMNDYPFKVVRLAGEFIWHSHADTAEAFLVSEGELRIDFRDSKVCLRPGELCVLPQGIEHKPYAEHDMKLTLIEARGVLNTGAPNGARTAKKEVWIQCPPVDRPMLRQLARAGAERNVLGSNDQLTLRGAAISPRRIRRARTMLRLKPSRRAVSLWL